MHMSTAKDLCMSDTQYIVEARIHASRYVHGFNLTLNEFLRGPSCGYRHHTRYLRVVILVEDFVGDVLQVDAVFVRKKIPLLAWQCPCAGSARVQR